MSSASWQRTIVTLVAISIVGIGGALLWPTRIARISCADGSCLILREVTYGTNHAWSSSRWHPSLRGSPLWRRGWEMVRDRFRSPSQRLLRTTTLQWRTTSQAIALWGVWDGRSEQPHSFRFVFLDKSGEEISGLQMQMGGLLRHGAGEGLVATATNLPPLRRLRVRVIEETYGQQRRPVGEFVVRNGLL